MAGKDGEKKSGGVGGVPKPPHMLRLMRMVMRNPEEEKESDSEELKKVRRWYKDEQARFMRAWQQEEQAFSKELKAHAQRRASGGKGEQTEAEKLRDGEIRELLLEIRSRVEGEKS